MGLNSKAVKSQPLPLDEVSASTKSEVETPASGSDLRAPSFNFFYVLANRDPNSDFCGQVEWKRRDRTN